MVRHSRDRARRCSSAALIVGARHQLRGHLWFRSFRAEQSPLTRRWTSLRVLRVFYMAKVNLSAEIRVRSVGNSDVRSSGRVVSTSLGSNLLVSRHTRSRCLSRPVALASLRPVLTVITWNSSLERDVETSGQSWTRVFQLNRDYSYKCHTLLENLNLRAVAYKMHMLSIGLSRPVSICKLI